MASTRLGKLKNIYSALYKKYPTVFNKQFTSIVNFKRASEYPIHRWYNYKEGYSPELIEWFVNFSQINENGLILDPFVGCGTTCLTSGQKGFASIGIESNPFAAFIAKVKTGTYSTNDIKKIEAIRREMTSLDFKPSIKPPQLKIIEKLFSDEYEDVLSQLLMYKEFILSIKPTHIKDFFFLAFLATLESVSNSRKGGNGLKNKLCLNKNLREKLFNQLDRMISDIKATDYKNFKQPEIKHSSALSLDLIINGKINGTIFSPPYLNCFDYTEIYKIELWMGDFVKTYEDLKMLRSDSIYSHLNTRRAVYQPENCSSYLYEYFLPLIKLADLWDKRIPQMVEGYFAEMSEVLQLIHNCSEKRSYTVIVVSNSAYANVVVPTDLLLTEIAEKIGFQPISIEIARHMVTSSQQYVKLGELNNYMRESVVILKK